MASQVVDDLDRIMAVMDAAFDPRWGEAWTRKQVSDSLIVPTTHYLLIDRDGMLDPPPEADAAGFLLSRAAPGEEELLLIGVHPDARGRALGGALIDRFVSEAAARGAEQVFLEMRRNNPAAALYAAKGFSPIGHRKDYYSLGDGSRLDAITFGKDCN